MRRIPGFVGEALASDPSVLTAWPHVPATSDARKRRPQQLHDLGSLVSYPSGISMEWWRYVEIPSLLRNKLDKKGKAELAVRLLAAMVLAPTQSKQVKHLYKS